MEDIIKKAVSEEDKRKSGSKKAKRDIFVIPKQQEDVHSFLISKLQSLGGQFSTFNSSSKKDQEKGYYKYNCLRFGKARTKSYRAVGCKAYVSYKINNDWQDYTVIIQHVFDQHNNHAVGDPSDGHSHCMDPELKGKIEELLALGTKPDVILTECHKWARNEGHCNVHDRAYFPTPRDIDNVRTTVMRRKRYHSNDSQSVEALVNGPLQDHVVFYQPYTSSQELIVLLQTPLMKANLAQHGKHIIFVDTTHCVNQYEFPLLTLMVRDGRGVPVAYAIISNECQSTLENTLGQLRKQLMCPPSAFMVDKDYAEINALSSIFPESAILLCWYHVTQAVQRWLSKVESGVHGPSNVKTRDDIMAYFYKLKSCKNEPEYEATSKEFYKVFNQHPAVCQYYRRHWEAIGHMWTDYGRCFEHLNSDTNNVIERFFRRLKYQFLGGIRNRRIDDLIHVLLGKAEEYFTVMGDLQCAGRVKNTAGHCPSSERAHERLKIPQHSAEEGLSLTRPTGENPVSTTVDKLKNLTQIIDSWKEIPDQVKDMVDNLHDHVVQASSVSLSFPTIVNNAKKIKPLFPPKKRNVDVGTTVPDYPLKKRSRHSRKNKYK